MGVDVKEICRLEVNMLMMVKVNLMSIRGMMIGVL